MMCISGPALHAGEQRAIQILGVLGAAQHEPATRTAQRLVRGGGHEVRVRNRARMNLRGHEAGDVGHVGDDRRADRRADAGDPGKIDDPRIRARTHHDHLGLVLVREPLHLLVVDALVLFADAVRNDRIELAGEVERMTVRQMSAVRQVHAEHRVSGLEQGEIDRHVGLRAGVRLHVGVLGAEELFRARDGQRFGDIHELAASVIALARIPLGVLVREDRARRIEHRLTHEVLRRDELETAVLTVAFVGNGLGDLRIGRGQRAPAGWGIGCRSHDVSCYCSSACI